MENKLEVRAEYPIDRILNKDYHRVTEDFKKVLEVIQKEIDNTTFTVGVVGWANPKEAYVYLDYLSKVRNEAQRMLEHYSFLETEQKALEALKP